MDFLALVQKLHEECGCSGTAPTAVTSQRGEAKRLVNWILRADVRIQKLYVDWKFLWEQYDQPATDDEASMPAPDDLAEWDFSTFKMVEEGSTEAVPIEAVEYNKVKTEILQTQSGMPSRVIVMPDNSLLLDPPPDGAHRIQADYWRRPEEMTANTDVSDIPEDFHDAILGRAMMSYGKYENAPEILDEGRELYDEVLARLENSQLPNEQNARYKSGGFFEVIAE